MPERVTKEERIISMAIEKARELKYLTNNSLANEPEMEKVTGKKTIDKKSDKITNETQKDSGYGLAGEITEFKKAVMLLKQVLESDYEDNPVFESDREEKDYLDLHQRQQQASADADASFKEMEMLLDEYKKDRNEKEFLPKIQNVVRMWMEQHKEVLPKPQQYR
jgi:hypothetical protein